MIPVPDFVKGLIFDCDGTLVDSMPLHLKAWEEAVRSYDAPYDHEFFSSKKGMRDADIVVQYNAHFGRSLSFKEVIQAKDRFFLQRISEVKPILPVVEIARRYHKLLPMAVASGGAKEIVHKELHAIGVVHFFEVILTADDPFRPKPHPDLFLEAARRINVEPSLCQVFEDGDLGLTAARNAGMHATDIRAFL
ncbi:MAG TPA: HAD family phosphatase [Bacteroidota bacterium]|nr:HAD family phosphatase [Bacteroidota bacterium]